jgi:hypothetical protein
MIQYCANRDILLTDEDFQRCRDCYKSIGNLVGQCKTYKLIISYCETVSLMQSSLTYEEVHKKLIKNYLREKKLKRILE